MKTPRSYQGAAAVGYASAYQSGSSPFQADWDEEYVDWLKNVRTAFVQDSTTVAGDDAQYQETVSGLGDTLANDIAGEQVIFTQTDAPAAATEANAIDAANDDYSVSVVDHLGDDANNTAKADSTWDIALANAASAYILANAQADKDAQIAYAQVPLGGSVSAAGSIYIKETADAELALTKSQADADLAWVKSKATADSGFLSDDASSWDGMVHTESQAVDTFAHADDAAAKTEGDAIGADEAGTMLPQAQADETQQSGDAAAAGDFSTEEEQQAATEWQTLANQLGTPWAEEQAGEASVEASTASTEAQNYEDYVSKLGTAETAYATSDASQFTDEVKAIDAVNQTDGDAAADADQTLTNTLADDETEVEQSAAGADYTYWVAVAQANHDYRVATTQAWHDEEVGGSFADYNTAMSTAASNQSLALNAAITQFHATVDPVTAITGQTDIDATLTHDTSIADLSLDDFTKTTQAQNSYSDLESGDYATQQKADNQAAHDLTVADANAEAAAMAAFAQANPSPWADEAAAEAQAKATQTIAAADAKLALDNQAADAQSAQEIAQADAAAARDIANAQRMHDQAVASAQQVHDLSTPTGVSVPDPITPPVDGTPPTLTADYGGGFEAGNLWLPDTTEDFISLPLEVPSGGEMEEPDAPGLVTDMVLGAMVVNGRQPYYGMLYGVLDFSAPLPFSVPGYYFFDNVSHDATPLYGDGSPNQDLPPGSAQAIASTNWSNGLPTVTSTATQPGPSGPSFFAQQAAGGGSGGSGSGGSGGTIVGKAPEEAQGPSSGQAPPPDANAGNRVTGDQEEANTVKPEYQRSASAGENIGDNLPHPRVYGPQAPPTKDQLLQIEREAALRQAITDFFANSVVPRLRQAMGDDPNYKVLLERLNSDAQLGDTLGGRSSQERLAIELGYIYRVLGQSARAVRNAADDPSVDGFTLRAQADRLLQLRDVVKAAYSVLGLDDVTVNAVNNMWPELRSRVGGTGIGSAAVAADLLISEYSAAIEPTGDEIDLIVNVVTLAPLTKSLAKGVAGRGLAFLGRFFASNAVKGAAPLAGAVAAQLPVRQMMQQLVDTAVAELSSNPAAMRQVLGKGAVEAAANNPELTNTFFGIAVEKMVAKRIADTPALQSLFTRAAQRGADGRFRSIYDFAGIGRGQGLLFDITTNADVVNHMGRWYGQLVEYITYDIPQGYRFAPAAP